MSSCLATKLATQLVSTAMMTGRDLPLEDVLGDDLLQWLSDFDTEPASESVSDSGSTVPQPVPAPPSSTLELDDNELVDQQRNKNTRKKNNIRDKEVVLVLPSSHVEYNNDCHPKSAKRARVIYDSDEDRLHPLFRNV